MAINKVKFGEVGGAEVYSYTLSNEKGLSAEIITYGGILRKLVYNGVDVVLGRDTMEEYLDNSGCFGALIGRNSNRIENAEFELNGKVYKLYANNGVNNLHGGKVGFDKKIWNAQEIDGEEPSLVLSLVSPDGEEGFPGTAIVHVTYTVTKDNGLKIHYTGECDEDTVLNMTNHSYFNLNGHEKGTTVGNHILQLNCGFYTPNTGACIPCGEILSVKDTPFDFTSPAVLEERLVSDYEQIEMFKGFDHNFVVDGRGYRKAGEITSDKTGITMEIYTDQTGMQIYSCNGTNESRVCKDGATYKVHGGICFETQAFPNNLKFSHFPSAILRKGEKYDTVTEYRFK